MAPSPACHRGQVASAHGKRNVRMRRRAFMTLLCGSALYPLTARAQQSKFRRIGYLDYGAGILPRGGFAPFHDNYLRKPLLEGLRERRWAERQNISIDGR